jgi:hypothetical protein
MANTISNSPETKKLDTLHSNSAKKPVQAVTVSESDKVVPTATASESKKSGPAVTTDVNKEPVQVVNVSESKKVVPAATASESKKPEPAVTADVKKEPVQVVNVSESKKVEVQKVKTLEAVAEPFTEPVWDLGNLLKTIKVTLNLWNIEPEIKPNLDTIDDDLGFFRLVSKENNLLVRRITGNLNAIKKLNLPAVLAVHLNKDTPPVYLALIKIDSRKVMLRGGKQDISIELSPVELESYWSGVAYIPWKNFLSLKGTIPINCPKDSIITLKMLLRDIGFKEIEINPFYDDKTQQAVKEIQKKYGLHIDGTVGSTTKIALYNEKNVFKQPHIVDAANSFVR